MDQGRTWSRWTAAAVLLVGSAVFWLAATQQGAGLFGKVHDDTLYWNVAGAIASGEGAVMLNLPGEPVLTKYPPLYPYFLSLFWGPASEGDSNLQLATTFSAIFAVLGFVAAYLQLRRWQGLGEVRAAICLALCALCGELAAMSQVMLSDCLFFALGLTALLFADREENGAWVLAAIFASFAVLTRTIGIALIGGIALHYVVSRRWRTAAVFGLAATIPLVATKVSRFSFESAPIGDREGFVQTWLYYTDYAGFWFAGMPDLDTLVGLLKMNLLEVVQTPGVLTLGPAPAGPVGLSVWATLAVAAIAGLWRLAKTDGLRAYHWALLFHLPLALLWNFEIAPRLLLMFTPLFWVGLTTEGSHAVRGFWGGVKGGKPALDRAVAALCLLLLASGVGWWGWRTTTGLVAGKQESETYEERYTDVIAWLRQHSDKEERLVAIDDGFLYAHTGRQGMWPIALTTDLRFKPRQSRLAEQLALLPDVAEEIDASYLVWTTNDYSFAPAVQERWGEWARGFCDLGVSNRADVRLYDLRCRAETPSDTSIAQR